MTYYTFRQNNSGGVFLAPAINLVVKSDSQEQATTIALANGMYFDPEYKDDCECCGQRWYGDAEATDIIPDINKLDAMYAVKDDVPAQIVIE